MPPRRTLARHPEAGQPDGCSNLPSTSGKTQVGPAAASRQRGQLKGIPVMNGRSGDARITDPSTATSLPILSARR